jgi:hypothetical protein
MPRQKRTTVGYFADMRVADTEGGNAPGVFQYQLGDVLPLARAKNP